MHPSPEYLPHHCTQEARQRTPHQTIWQRNRLTSLPHATGPIRLRCYPPVLDVALGFFEVTRLGCRLDPEWCTASPFCSCLRNNFVFINVWMLIDHVDPLGVDVALCQQLFHRGLKQAGSAVRLRGTFLPSWGTVAAPAHNAPTLPPRRVRQNTWWINILAQESHLEIEFVSGFNHQLLFPGRKLLQNNLPTAATARCRGRHRRSADTGGRIAACRVTRATSQAQTRGTCQGLHPALQQCVRVALERRPVPTLLPGRQPRASAAEADRLATVFQAYRSVGRFSAVSWGVASPPQGDSTAAHPQRAAACPYALYFRKARSRTLDPSAGHSKTFAQAVCNSSSSPGSHR